MPKTNEKDAYFFSHDCNARNDPKILALRSVYGAEGYGVYFMLVEILREQPEYRLSVNKYIWNTLAMQMQVEASHLEQIITDCCTEFAENGSTLLVNDGEYLYSASLLRRMGKVDDISNLRREAAQKRWKNQPCKADDGSGASTSNAYAWLLSAGYNTTQAGKLAGYYADWMKNQGGSGDSGSDAQIGNRHGDSWIYIPGHGRFTYDEVENYVNSGKVIETYDSATNTYTYKWNGNKK